MKKLICSILSLMLLILFSSCTIKNHSESVLPREKFLFLQTSFMTLVCDESRCGPQMARGAASGVLVAKDKRKQHSYVLTAAHVCKPEFEEQRETEIKFQILEIKIQDFTGKYHEALTLDLDEEHDLCLLRIEELLPSDPIRFAEAPPRPGSHIWNLAAPGGVWSPDNVIIFEGYYTGIFHTNGFATYSLPVAPGSSGSPVLNDEHELIGIIMAAVPPSFSLGFGAAYHDLRRFLKKNISNSLLQPES